MALFTDDFNRADSATLGTGWSNMPSVNTLRNRIVSNNAAGETAGGTSADYIDSMTFPADLTVTLQLSAVVINLGERLEVFTRAINPAHATNLGGYRFRIAKASTNWDWAIMTRNPSGGALVTLATVNATLAATDLVRVRCEGNILKWQKFVSGAWSDIVSWDNTSDTLRFTTSGAVGLVHNGAPWRTNSFEVDSLVATGPGQYGWGSYGDGDYGSNYGAAASGIPIVGSESFTVSEGAEVDVVLDRAESVSLAEALVLDAQYVAVDSATQTEGTVALLIQEAKAAADSQAQAEASAAASALSASDAWALTEASSPLVTLVASEILGMVEASAISAQIAASDALTLSEIVNSVGEQASFSASDAWALSEAAATSNSLSASETHALTEVASLAAALALSENITAAEAVAILATIATSESGTLSEASNVSTVDLKSATDSWNFTEGVSNVQSVDLKTAIETFGASELASLAATLAASDVSTLTDLSSLSVVLAVSDSLALSEGPSSVATGLLVTDTLSLTESPGVVETVQLKAVAEAFGFAESAIIFLPSASPDIRRPTTALIVPLARTAAVTAKSSTVAVPGRTRTVVVAGRSFDVTVLG